MSEKEGARERVLNCFEIVRDGLIEMNWLRREGKRMKGKGREKGKI